MDESSQDFIFNQIENTEPLPDTILNTIKKYYPNYFKQGVWESIFHQMIGTQRNQCQCREVYFKNLNRKVTFSAEIFALELEDRFSQEKCYSYNLQTINYGSDIIGIRAAARKIYHKELTLLKEIEILELNIIRENPSFYSGSKGKKELRKIIEQLQ